MLTFNLKKEWFDKIKSGEKTHEYREVKPYWTKRLKRIILGETFIKLDDPSYGFISHFKMLYDNAQPIWCYFMCGYPKKNNAYNTLRAVIKRVTIEEGYNTDLKIDKPVYDIEFELL